MDLTYSQLQSLKEIKIELNNKLPNYSLIDQKITEIRSTLKQVIEKQYIEKRTRKGTKG